MHGAAEGERKQTKREQKHIDREREKQKGYGERRREEENYYSTPLRPERERRRLFVCGGGHKAVCVCVGEEVFIPYFTSLY